MPECNALDPAFIAYRQTSLERAKDYVTTNGLIQVSLCGLFATTIAVLVALGEQGGSSAKPIVYESIIPVFSFIILTVSFKVYTWIAEQLWYIAHFGRNPQSVKRFMSLEEWLDLREVVWKKRNPIARFVYIIIRTLTYYVSIPFSMNDIYCYYFLLYMAAPILSLAHMYSGRDLWVRIGAVVGGQLISALIGLRNAIRLGILDREIRQRLLEI